MRASQFGAWVRGWRRSPLLTAQYGLTIAVGMGAVAAVVSLMLTLGYQPLPYREPSQLVAVWERIQSGAPVAALSPPDIADFASATTGAFSAFDAFDMDSYWLLDHRGAEQVTAYSLQPGAFSALGINPVLGRGWRPGDQRASAGATAPAWISNRLWRARYGGSPAVLGATVGLAENAAGKHEERFRIVGVLPTGSTLPLPFFSGADVDVWFVMPEVVSGLSRKSYGLFALGRLRPGVAMAQAQAALTVVGEQLGRRYRFERRRRPVVESMEAIAQGPARRTMGLLALGVGLVFLVGCVNVAILMVAEGARRRREIAIRAALGAGRWRLWREVAAEKCVLMLLALGLGVAFALTLLRGLAHLVPAAGIGAPLPHPPPLNLGVLLGFAASALALALVWSALLVAAADGQGSALALACHAGLEDGGGGRGRWRLVLLAAQAGIGICLLAAAALAARTYATLSAANLGPAPRHTVLLSVSPRQDAAISDTQTFAFNQQILSRLQPLPGTQAVALADEFPPLGAPANFMERGDGAGTERAATAPMAVSNGFFNTLGIPVLFGRSFDEADNRPGGEAAVIINLEMAQRNWPSPRRAVGSEIAFGTAFKNPYRVVGVVGNFNGFWYQQPVPTAYLPESHSYTLGGEVILRTNGSPMAAAALARQALAGLSAPAQISHVSTMQARWQATVTRPLARMTGMFLLALLGLSLCLQGVYAVAAATVEARGHELAVRSALGAPAGSLAWHLTRNLVLAVVAGATAGAVAATELRPLLVHWLGAVATEQAEPIAVAIALLALAAAVGCFFPARAAARSNPAEALRRS
ncbi:MAG TPA: ABC transporter permease [Terriglobales bacterium]|nr:ABC transporter permease [Terriglobales bacterium]